MALLAIDMQPTDKQLRRFGAIATVFFGGIGAWVFLKQSLLGFAMGNQASQITAGVLWALGAWGLVGVAVPRLAKPLYVGLNVVTLPIGFVVGHVVVFVIWFGVFTPVALIFRLMGRDALGKRPDPTASTYWEPLEQNIPAGRYFKQF